MSTLSLPDLMAMVSRWRADKCSVGFTCGAFDLIHAGHVDYLQKARGLCDRLIVAVNSDSSIRTYKNPLRPINFQADRLRVISALACVDAATLLDDVRPESMIQSLHPDLYIKGGDYQVGQLRSAPLVESYGGSCVVIPVSQDVSTTATIGRIMDLQKYANPDRAPVKGARPIVFLDRDGTLIQDVPFINSPFRVALIPGVGEGLRKLQDHGFLLVVVTNQQGIALGYFDYDVFVSVNSRMLSLLSSYGVEIDRFYFCPHSLADHCSCRKPEPKMVEEALRYFGSAASKCFFIGDTASDMKCAERAGCTPVLLGGKETQSDFFAAANFDEAVEYVIATSRNVAKLTAEQAVQ